MEIWLDTTNIVTIHKAIHLGILSGVTTNPTLLADLKKNFEEILEELLHHHEGPLAVQVVAEDAQEMVQQGQDFFKFSNRVIVKVPVTKAGLEAIHLLSRQGIPTMATVLFNPHQALMASLAGADYVAPYLSRIADSGGDPWVILKTIVQIFHNYKIKTKILGASIRGVDQVVKCAEIGIYGVTVRDEIFEKLIDEDPLTRPLVHKFAADWACIKAG